MIMRLAFTTRASSNYWPEGEASQCNNLYHTGNKSEYCSSCGAPFNRTLWRSWHNQRLINRSETDALRIYARLVCALAVVEYCLHNRRLCNLKTCELKPSNPKKLVQDTPCNLHL